LENKEYRAETEHDESWHCDAIGFSEYGMVAMAWGRYAEDHADGG